MREYYYKNRSPLSVPVWTKGAKLPQYAQLEEIQDQEVQGERLMVDLMAVQQQLNKEQTETLKLRLMGYKVDEIAQILGRAKRTVERQLEQINSICKGEKCLKH